MKYKPITKITNGEIKRLLTAMYGDMIKCIVNIKKDFDDESVTVTFVTRGWDDGEGGDETLEFENEITMYSDYYDPPDFSPAQDDRLKYKQFMIAKGYSMYWQDNPFI